MSHCQSLASSIGSRQGELLLNAYISELKESYLPEHEYIAALLSFRLDSSDPINLSTIKCERTVHEGVTPAQHASFVVNDSVRGSVSPPSLTFSSSDLTTDANDRVFIFDPDHTHEAIKDNDRVVCQWTYLGGSALPLTRLIVSASVLHIKAPFYTLGPSLVLLTKETRVASNPGRFMDLFCIVTRKDVEAQAGEIEPAVQERFIHQNSLLRTFREERRAAQAATARIAVLEEGNAAKDAALAAKDDENCCLEGEAGSDASAVELTRSADLVFTMILVAAHLRPRVDSDNNDRYLLQLFVLF
ncbi:hypothetical protein BD413DRAFT_679253 [Trametes elegans]|nr:hypothetical protein BD413DRAFT_679253 [Trametes elegans]